MMGICCDTENGDNLNDAGKRVNVREWRCKQGWEWITLGVEMEMKMRNE